MQLLAIGLALVWSAYPGAAPLDSKRWGGWLRAQTAAVAGGRRRAGRRGSASVRVSVRVSVSVCVLGGAGGVDEGDGWWQVGRMLLSFAARRQRRKEWARGGKGRQQQWSGTGKGDDATARLERRQRSIARRRRLNTTPVRQRLHLQLQLQPPHMTIAIATAFVPTADISPRHTNRPATILFPARTRPMSPDMVSLPPGTQLLSYNTEPHVPLSSRATT